MLRAYWDGEDEPSIETPIGDFFGMGHARTRNFASLPVQASPEDGKAFNCYFPMPFGSHMKFTVTNEAEDDLLFYYYVDLELHDELEEGLGRFHAQYRQDRPEGIDETGLANEQVLFGGENTDGRDNYTILDAEGHGHYVGVLFNVYSLRRSHLWDWYGEGDDMIFVDGEPGLSVPDTIRKPDPRIGPKAALIADRGESSPGANDAWPPTLHGTGTEDYFNTAWCPTQEYSAPYHGIIAAGGPELDRAGDALPLAHRGSGDLPQAHPRDHRARPCQPSRGRDFFGGVLVPGGAAQAVRQASGSEGSAAGLPVAVPELGRGL